MAVPCRVTTKNFCPLGVIEGQTDGLPVATSLNRPGAQGRVVARCLNLTGQLMKLKAGTTIGTKNQVKELLKKELIEPAGGAWSSPGVLVKKKKWKLAFLC